MEALRKDAFWKIWATLGLVVLAKLAFGSAVSGGRNRFELVRPLHAQGVAMDESALCTTTPDGRTLYCWSVVHSTNGPIVTWKGAYHAP